MVESWHPINIYLKSVIVFILCKFVVNPKKLMAMIDDILEFNKKFVESKGYEKYITNKYPDKK